MKTLFAGIVLSTLFAVSEEAAVASEGAQLYLQRCANCHDSGQTGIPPRTQLAARPQQFIVEKLMFGSMQSQTLGLSEAQIALIASYLLEPAKAAP